MYLIMMFVFIPVPFCLLSLQTREFGSGGRSCVPHYDVCLYSRTILSFVFTDQRVWEWWQELCTSSSCLSLFPYHFVFCLSRPESLGVVAGAVYLIMMFVFIPVPFWKPLTDDEPEFPHHEVYYIQ